jgi:hypothetical protein
MEIFMVGNIARWGHNTLLISSALLVYIIAIMLK